MSRGTLYGVGVGPGDPELVTQKAISILNRERIIYAPRARGIEDSLALKIVERHIRNIETKVIEIIDYPLTTNSDEKRDFWKTLAGGLIGYLHNDENVVYLTLGDPSVYSTYAYLVRALRELDGDVDISTIPGISSYSLAACLVNQPLAEGDEDCTICSPAAGLDYLSEILDNRKNIVIMKIGRRMGEIIDLIREKGLLTHAAFVARAGLKEERVETDLSRLEQTDTETGNLSVILIRKGIV
jgi:precorrin-2/cobalt-factor-2 C20-methyltransferase